VSIDLKTPFERRPTLSPTSPGRPTKPSASLDIMPIAPRFDSLTASISIARSSLGSTSAELHAAKLQRRPALSMVYGAVRPPAAGAGAKAKVLQASPKRSDRASIKDEPSGGRQETVAAAGVVSTPCAICGSAVTQKFE
jgi:hypothetical protein